MKPSRGRTAAVLLGAAALLVAAYPCLRWRDIAVRWHAAPASGLVVGEKGLPGFYFQTQSLVFPEHAKMIVEHLQTLGYGGIWQRPMKQRPGIPPSFIIRLGPYPTKEAASAAMKEFAEKIKKNPLKKPRLDWSSLFVLPHQVAPRSGT